MVLEEGFFLGGGGRWRRVACHAESRGEKERGRRKHVS